MKNKGVWKCLARFTMQRELVFCVFYIVMLASVSDTKGTNLTFLGKGANLSSRYEEHSYRRDRYPGEGLLSPQDGKGFYCKYPAQCQQLNYTTCMGLKLPYSLTTLNLALDSRTQEEIQVKFNVFLNF